MPPEDIDRIERKLDAVLREWREDKRELFQRIGKVEAHGCPLGEKYPDHEKRIRDVERIALALGTSPADHEKRIRSLEDVKNRIMGAVFASGIGGGGLGALLARFLG